MGGSRALAGIGVRFAIRVAGAPGSASVKVDREEKWGATGGGAPQGRHITQSSAWPGMVGAVESTSVGTSLAVPTAVQTSDKPCGLTQGAATAAPMDSANHTNTQRMRERQSRSDSSLSMPGLWRTGRHPDRGDRTGIMTHYAGTTNSPTLY